MDSTSEQPPTKRFTAIQLPPIFGLLAGIDIPAGESNYTISDSFVIPVDIKAFGVSGHAHYLAKQLIMTATLPSGEMKTLLAIRDWDFGWRSSIFKESAGRLGAGAPVVLDDQPAHLLGVVVGEPLEVDQLGVVVASSLRSGS